jgi:hypothetical protein
MWSNDLAALAALTFFCAVVLALSILVMGSAY